MNKEYNLSKLKKRRNPYAKHLKRQVTLRMSVEAIDYFKNLAEETGLSYLNLIKLYLLDCSMIGRKPNTHWSP
jgi:predicted DNA binding CopG/RHH family protein